MKRSIRTTARRFGHATDSASPTSPSKPAFDHRTHVGHGESQNSQNSPGVSTRDDGETDYARTPSLPWTRRPRRNSLAVTPTFQSGSPMREEHPGDSPEKGGHSLRKRARVNYATEQIEDDVFVPNSSTAPRSRKRKSHGYYDESEDPAGPKSKKRNTSFNLDTPSTRRRNPARKPVEPPKSYEPPYNDDNDIIRDTIEVGLSPSEMDLDDSDDQSSTASSPSPKQEKSTQEPISSFADDIKKFDPKPNPSTTDIKDVAAEDSHAKETNSKTEESKFSKTEDFDAMDIDAEADGTEDNNNKPSGVVSLEIKPADAKPSDTKSTDIAPSDTKSSDTKSSDIKPSDIKPSDTTPSDIKPSDTAPSDIKPSNSAPSDPKPSDATPSDATPSDTKLSDTKSSVTRPSDTRPSDIKPSDTKPSDIGPSDINPSDTTPSDIKPTSTESSDTKPSVTEPVDTKPVDAKPSEARPVDTSVVDTNPVEAEPPQAKPSDSSPSENKPFEVQTSEAKPSETISSEPKSSDPIVSETKPSDVEASDTSVADTKTSDTGVSTKGSVENQSMGVHSSNTEASDEKPINDEVPDVKTPDDKGDDAESSATKHSNPIVAEAESAHGTSASVTKEDAPTESEVKDSVPNDSEIKAPEENVAENQTSTKTQGVPVANMDVVSTDTEDSTAKDNKINSLDKIQAEPEQLDAIEHPLKPNPSDDGETQAVEPSTTRSTTDSDAKIPPEEQADDKRIDAKDSKDVKDDEPVNQATDTEEEDSPSTEAAPAKENDNNVVEKPGLEDQDLSKQLPDEMEVDSQDQPIKSQDQPPAVIDAVSSIEPKSEVPAQVAVDEKELPPVSSPVPKTSTLEIEHVKDEPTAPSPKQETAPSPNDASMISAPSPAPEEPAQTVEAEESQKDTPLNDATMTDSQHEPTETPNSLPAEPLQPAASPVPEDRKGEDKPLVKGTPQAEAVPEEPEQSKALQRVSRRPNPAPPGRWSHLTPYVEGEYSSYPEKRERSEDYDVSEDQSQEDKDVNKDVNDVDMAMDDPEDGPLELPTAALNTPTRGSPVPESVENGISNSPALANEDPDDTEVAESQELLDRSLRFKYRKLRDAEDFISVVENYEDMSTAELYEVLQAISSSLSEWQDEWSTLGKVVDDFENASRRRIADSKYETRTRNLDLHGVNYEEPDFVVKGYKAKEKEAMSETRYLQHQDRTMAAAYGFEYDPHPSKIGRQNPETQQAGVTTRGRALRNQPRQTVKASEADGVTGKRQRKPVQLFDPAIQDVSRSSTPVPSRGRKRKNADNDDGQSMPASSFNDDGNSDIEGTPTTSRRRRNARAKATASRSDAPSSQAQDQREEPSKTYGRRGRPKSYREDFEMSRQSDDFGLPEEPKQRRHLLTLKIPKGTTISETASTIDDNGEQRRPSTSSSDSTTHTVESSYSFRPKRQKRFRDEPEEGDEAAPAPAKKRGRRSGPADNGGDFVMGDTGSLAPEAPPQAASTGRKPKIKVMRPAPESRNGTPTSQPTTEGGDDQPKEYRAMTKSEKMSASMKNRWANGNMAGAVEKRKATLAAKKAAQAAAEQKVGPIAPKQKSTKPQKKESAPLVENPSFAHPQQQYPQMGQPQHGAQHQHVAPQPQHQQEFPPMNIPFPTNR